MLGKGVQEGKIKALEDVSYSLNSLLSPLITPITVPYIIPFKEFRLKLI